MLKVTVITQQNDVKFWQETFSNVWEGPVDISLQNNYQGKDNTDLVIFDFSAWEVNALDVLNDVSPNLAGKHFLIVSDKKDADLAIEAIRLGAIGFLVKPFKRFELIQSLLRYLGKFFPPLYFQAKLLPLYFLWKGLVLH